MTWREIDEYQYSVSLMWPAAGWRGLYRVSSSKSLKVVALPHTVEPLYVDVGYIYDGYSRRVFESQKYRLCA